MFKVLLPILKNTEETQKMDDMDLTINYNNCDVEDILFFRINAIANVFEDGRNWTEVLSNGSVYISPMPIGEITQLMEKQFNLSNYTL